MRNWGEKSTDYSVNRKLKEKKVKQRNEKDMHIDEGNETSKIGVQWWTLKMKYRWECKTEKKDQKKMLRVIRKLTTGVEARRGERRKE